MRAGRLQSYTTSTEIPANNGLPALCLARRCGLCSSWASQQPAASSGEPETCHVGRPAQKLLSRTGVEIVSLETGLKNGISEGSERNCSHWRRCHSNSFLASLNFLSIETNT